MKERKECWLCKQKAFTDVHHVFNGALKAKSEKYGALINVCRKCHNEIHKDAGLRTGIKTVFQKKIMRQQNWTINDWRKNFYKSYLED